MQKISLFFVDFCDAYRAIALMPSDWQLAGLSLVSPDFVETNALKKIAADDVVHADIWHLVPYFIEES